MTFPSTEVRLISNVPLNNSYEHQMDFVDVSAQLAYFLSFLSVTVGSEFTYQREDSAIKVNVSYDNLTNTNYVMYRNNDYTTKWFYGFITKKEYINPNCTKVYFELDVFQTWQFEINWKASYIEREHSKRWNPDGSPVVNTIDEGMNYGSEYETVKIENYKPFDNILFLVIVSKSTLHNDAGATPPIVEKEIQPILNGLPQPLSYYVHPFKQDGSIPSLKVNGVTKTLTTIDKTLLNMFTMDATVNNIVTMYVTNHIGRYIQYDGTTVDFDGSAFKQITIADNVHENINTLYVTKIPTYDEMTKDLGDKYSGYQEVTESKLLMYPYTVTILDDLKGNRVTLKNEYINDTNLNIRVRGSLGTSNKVTYSVDDYLTHSGVDFEGMTNVTLENSIVDLNANDIPVLSDYLSAFLQGNRNSLANQRESMLFNAFTGVMGGAMGGGLPGAVIGSGISMGNSYFQIQGLNAKIKDISNVPPSMGKLGGNVNFDFGNGLNGLFVIKKQITKEYRDLLTTYFKMFGYKVNQLKIPDLRTRQHFNYIKVVGANIYGNAPTDDIQKIKTMFETGVTLWHTSDIGNYSASNGEI